MANGILWRDIRRKYGCGFTALNPRYEPRAARLFKCAGFQRLAMLRNILLRNDHLDE
jgi:hypothetical protein